jgi:ABC-2 type transport system ATP-binding protein
VSAVVEVESLGKRFGAFEAVRDVSFRVERGEIFGYLGANGAGKSTTIRMLCGLLAPSSGRAMVAGHDVSKDPAAVRARVGYMSQKFSLYPELSALENMDFFGGAYGLPREPRRRRARALLEQVGFEGGIDLPVRALPGGLRQRVALATALLHEPSVVFLDEPTAGVDPAARRGFWRLIRSLSDAGTTVFVTTHYMDEAEYCHRVALMVAGRLVALDTPAALKRDHVEGVIVAVRGRGLRAEALSGLDGVLDVVPFGAGLHVRTRGLEIDALARALSAAGASELELETTEPTLEDVFLAVTSAAVEGST